MSGRLRSFYLQLSFSHLLDKCKNLKSGPFWASKVILEALESGHIHATDPSEVPLLVSLIHFLVSASPNPIDSLVGSPLTPINGTTNETHWSTWVHPFVNSTEIVPYTPGLDSSAVTLSQIFTLLYTHVSATYAPYLTVTNIGVSTFLFSSTSLSPSVLSITSGLRITFEIIWVFRIW